MLNKCDILILTAKFGAGHVSVSNALKEHIHACDQTIKIDVADMHEIMHPKSYKGIYRSYEFMVRHLPKIYNQYYFGKENFSKLQKLDTASHGNLKKLARFLEEKAPKLVISTFPLCTGYMSKYKETYNSDLPLLTCITDVVDNSEWLYDGNDIYFVAGECVKDSLIKKGISEDKIYITGIPVRGRFLKKEDRDNLKRRLGFLESDRIILMMGGGLGLFPKGEDFYEWLGTLKSIKVIVLTGRNEKLYEKLSSLDVENIMVYKQTDKVAEYMRISDVLVGKSGGITLFEAIASTLPIIVYKPILGQEIKNCQYIQEKQIGIVVHHLEQLKESLLQVLNESVTRKQMVSNLEELQNVIQMSLLGMKITEIYHKTDN